MHDQGQELLSAVLWWVVGGIDVDIDGRIRHGEGVIGDWVNDDGVEDDRVNDGSVRGDRCGGLTLL